MYSNKIMSTGQPKQTLKISKQETVKQETRNMKSNVNEINAYH